MTQHKPQTPPYRLRFEQIYQYRPRGGRRLADLFTAPLPGDGLIGEAWALSDRDDRPIPVASGPLKERTIGQWWSLAGGGGSMHFSAGSAVTLLEIALPETE